MRTFLLAALCLSAGSSRADDFRIEHGVILTSRGEYHWSQSRAAVIPGHPFRVVVVSQEIEKRGSHGYRDLFLTETRDGGQTWSRPARIDNLRRHPHSDGIERVLGDACPQWHARTGKLLVTGKCFGFLPHPDPGKARDDRSLERVAYAVHDPATGSWSEMKILGMPETDHAGHPILEPNAGCHQRVDLPDGTVLLPVRYRADPDKRVYTTLVARCSFDGSELAYREHGSEHSIAIPRGLYEPSLCRFQDRFFLTMRGEENGHVARGDDGIHFGEAVPWTFDDGSPLLSANAQQHWISRPDALYLAYSRKGADNDHVFRNRAPLFIARVDPDKLTVIRASERVLMPETGLDLAGGFGTVDVGADQTWVVSSEMAFPPDRKEEDNRVLLAKILWTP